MQAVSISFPLDGRGKAWGGLGKKTAKQSLMDDTPLKSGWWMAIGAKQGPSGGSTIPGPRDVQVTTVQLYVFGKA